MNALGGRWKTQEAKNRSMVSLALGRARSRWRGNLSIPEHCPPLVRQFFEIMNNEMVSLCDIGPKSGIQYDTISNWRYRSSPTLVLFQAALNALGYDLKIVKLRDVSEKKRGPKPKGMMPA